MLVSFVCALRRLAAGFHARDAVWILLFGTLAWFSPTLDASEAGLLAALAGAQIAEPKLARLTSARVKGAWILLKLLLAYLLIGYTGGLTSPYYLILLLPVVSAATALGNTLLFTVLAGGAYLSFLLNVDWSTWTVGPAETRELARRVVFLAMTGNLAIALAESVRVQSGNYKAAAEQLAEANRSLREAEAAVRRSDRLAALGQLSAGLAHELRNPLGTIRASSEMLGRSVAAENEVAREVAGFISSEVDRCNALVTRFLEFARPLELRPAAADLTRIIDTAMEQVRREPGLDGIAFFKNYSPDLAPFPLDAQLMERVVYNLLLNAAQATAPGGAVTVKTRAAGGAAEIAVIDRGCGIKPARLETIFNPFVTSKPQGVGLAIVSKIVDEHGGKITVESEPGKGSIFRVILPMAREAHSAISP